VSVLGLYRKLIATEEIKVSCVRLKWLLSPKTMEYPGSFKKGVRN